MILDSQVRLMSVERGQIKAINEKRERGLTGQKEERQLRVGLTQS